MMIPFQRPALPTTTDIDRYLDLSRERRWFSNGGPCWHLLRERLSDRVGAYCVPVASGTLGLMVAIAAVLNGRGPRPERVGAVMPSFTFLATAQAGVWAGLQPILADIAPDHWHLDPLELERGLGDRSDIAAVIAVSAFGTPPLAETRERWERACARAQVPLVIDSAAGFGAVAEDGVPIGAQGDVEVVSFHATKPFAVGEGGAVFTRSRELCERLELAVNFGFGSGHSVDLDYGLNAKMSELHAATALAVLDRLDSILERRRRSAAAIREQAGPEIGWQRGCEHSTWQFVPVSAADSKQRKEIVRACGDRVETRVYYQPLDALAPGRWQLLRDGLPATVSLHDRVLALPMANDLDDADLDAIAAVLRPA